MNLIIDLIDAIAWPGTLLLLVHWFKADIREFLQDIQELKAGSVTAKKFDRIKEAAAHIKSKEARNSISPLRPGDGAAPVKPQQTKKNWSGIAEFFITNPDKAAKEAWIEVKSQIQSLCEKANFDNLKSTTDQAIWLNTVGHIDDNTLSVILGLENIIDDIDVGVSLSSSQAAEFMAYSFRVTNELDKAELLL